MAVMLVDERKIYVEESNLISTRILIYHRGGP